MVVMTSDETQIQMFADWSMSHVIRETKDKRQNPEYHTVVVVRSMRTDKNCHGQTLLKLNSVLDLKRTHAPPKELINTNDRCKGLTANENAAGIRITTICFTLLL